MAIVDVCKAWIKPQTSQDISSGARSNGPDLLRVLVDNNVDEISNVVRKPGDKKTDETTERGVKSQS